MFNSTYYDNYINSLPRFSNVFLKVKTMRQKKSNLWIYLSIIAVIGLILFVAVHEVPLKSEHVEQPLDNTFLDK